MCTKITWDLHHKLHDLFVITVNKFFSDTGTIPKIELDVDDVGDDEDLGYAVQMNEEKTCWGVLSGQVYTANFCVVDEEEKINNTE